MSLSSIPWHKILLQSLTVFSLLLVLGLALLALGTLWPRTRRRHRNEYLLRPAGLSVRKGRTRS